MVVRVKKEHSAYVYQILESYEGVTNYSTVTIGKDSPYREIALHFAPDLKPYLERLLGHLSQEIPLTLDFTR